MRKFMLACAVVFFCCCHSAITPVCGVVNVMDAACDLVTVEYQDPETGERRAESIPKEQLTWMAERQRQNREKCKASNNVNQPQAAGSGPRH